MNTKEAKISLYYIKKILNSDLVPDETSRLLRLVSRHSLELFGFELAALLRKAHRNIEDEEQIAFIGKLTNGQVFPNAMIPDEKTFDKISKITAERKEDFYDIDITQPDFDISFTSVCDAFDVPMQYRSLLQYFVYATKIPFLQRFVNAFNDRFTDSVMDSSNIDIAVITTGIQIEDIKKALSSNGVFMDAGIVTKGYSDVDFSPMFSRLLNNEFSCVEDVCKQLTGDTLHTDLTKENFDYIGEDYDRLVKMISAAVKSKQPGINILLYGKPGSGKTELIKSVCNYAGLNLYSTPENKEEKTSRLSALSNFQAVLKKEDKSVILFDEAEDVFSVDPFDLRAPSKLYINRRLEKNIRPVIWISNKINKMDTAYIRRFSMALEIKDPDEKAKKYAWQRVFDKYDVKVSDDELSHMINKYKVPMAMVDTAVKNAKMLDDKNMIEYTFDNLMCAMTGVKPFNKNNNVKNFDTSLLNTDVDLEKLAENIKNKNIKSFSLCLYGAPGTGKSAFAEYLADVLGMPIVKKRASDLLDAYVGNTEKRIAQAFAEAREQKAILVFDEADSFLRNREGAFHSWEVTHVNEMLTQMENAEYPFICTTNLMSDLDKASIRRFSFKVKYNFMNAKQIIKAFKHFFDMEVDESDIQELNKLAPGDFKVVQKQSVFLDAQDKQQIIEMLLKEQASKDIRSSGITRTKIGF
ncbi:MAG: AAA family ATPase [Alphaproteobacteria bacterium]|nr:AAA family ATPase [Alphaproteobacteria bacterium]